MNANSEFSTDRITISRSTLKQVLEALEKYIARELTVGQRYTNEGQQMLDAAPALRAALAQQAEPVQAISECLAVLRPMVKGKFPHEQALEELVGYTVPPQQAEPVEPVPAAVVATQSDVWRGYNGQWAPPGEPIKMVQMLRDLPTGTLLYTAPPPPRRKEDV